MPLRILSDVGQYRAIAHITKYFGAETKNRPTYTGSKFETFAGGGDAVEPNRITTEDLIAVSMFSVHVPAQAALGVLGELSEELSSHLARLPLEARFEKLSQADFEKYLGDNGPAASIWNLLRQPGARWGAGQTIASKVIARKRLHLVPIYDSIVAEAAGLPGSRDQWTHWFSAFHGKGGTAGVESLQDIREKSGQDHLSLLRVLDIVVWMERRGGDNVFETVGVEYWT